MRMNQYDDCRVSLPRQKGKGNLDIVWASQTHRKASVTEALGHNQP